MAHCMVTLSANAGVSLVMGQTRIWVDALHREKVPGFSALTPALWARLLEHPAFQPPDLLCFTHCHKDHYDRALVQQAHQLWPHAGLILPEPAFERQVLLDTPSADICFQGIDLHFFRLPHEGAAYAQTAHYGLLLSQDRFRILITGDCQIAAPALEEALAGQPVDLAVMDFPWLTLPRGRDFLRRVIRPRCLLVCHLPFQDDDRFGYRRAAERALCRLPEVPDVRLLLTPFQSEIIS